MGRSHARDTMGSMPAREGYWQDCVHLIDGPCAWGPFYLFRLMSRYAGQMWLPCSAAGRHPAGRLHAHLNVWLTTTQQYMATAEGQGCMSTILVSLLHTMATWTGHCYDAIHLE